MAILVNVIGYLAYILTVLVIAQFVLSLLISFNVVNYSNKFVSSLWTALNALLDPLLKPIRKILPNTGAIDFSPMVLIIGLNVLMMILDGLSQGY
ncbi:YggT family protein [Croceicoccus sp. BE223]|uniref:YggT family protein n=1 Tax=Croceicoccus sp. BE223 TaxID=2817716 RepID=UPI00285DB132|nr:YggT family protein [Croceicoccus sp. BE223]